VPSITGLWRWSVEEDPNFPNPAQAPQGYFSFSEDGKGGISGHSYVQLTFPDTIVDAKSMLSVSAFKGERKITGGQDSINFVLKISNSTTIASEARIVEGGKVLEGSSAATVKYEDKPITINYRWKATRENS
jgi:hypothetical protein